MQVSFDSDVAADSAEALIECSTSKLYVAWYEQSDEPRKKEKLL